jgi:hypothetical protein
MLVSPAHLSLPAEIPGRDARASLFHSLSHHTGRSRADVSGCGPCVTTTDQEPERVSFGKAVQSVAWRASRSADAQKTIQVGRPAAGGGLDLGLDHAHCRASSAPPSPVQSSPAATATQASTPSKAYGTRIGAAASAFFSRLQCNVCARSGPPCAAARCCAGASRHRWESAELAVHTVTHTARPARRRHGVLFGSSTLLRHRRGCGRFIFQTLRERTLPSSSIFDWPVLLVCTSHFSAASCGCFESRGASASIHIEIFTLPVSKLTATTF